jgi:hypothetical protein
LIKDFISKTNRAPNIEERAFLLAQLNRDLQYRHLNFRKVVKHDQMLVCVSRYEVIIIIIIVVVVVVIIIVIIMCHYYCWHIGRYKCVVSSVEAQDRTGGNLRLTCFNEQAKLLFNDNPVVLCALQDKERAMLPLTEEETIRLAFMHCGYLDGSERSMKLKKKGRFVNFVEYV